MLFETINKQINVYMGLDIGSSTTKVVVKQLYGDDNYVIDFKEYGLEGESYLLPTRISYDKENDWWFVPEINESADYEDLKYKFMKNEKNSAEPLIAYVAWVIKYVKEYFEEKYSKTDIFKGKKIIWNINMGIPVEQFNDGEEKKYKTILQNAVEEYEIMEIEDLNVVPEIVATLQSLVARENKVEGLYCAIDVGATTLDMCTFRMFNDETGPDYSFYVTRVDLYGNNRYKESNNKEEFLNNCYSSMICPVIWTTYKKHAGREPEWKTGLPIVLCGGGSKNIEYKKLIYRYDHDILSRLGEAGYKGVKYVQLPDDKYICECKNIDPMRLAVAQGLSYSSGELDRNLLKWDETERPYEDPDQRPLIKRIEEELRYK